MDAGKVKGLHCTGGSIEKWVDGVVGKFGVNHAKCQIEENENR